MQNVTTQPIVLCFIVILGQASSHALEKSQCTSTRGQIVPQSITAYEYLPGQLDVSLQDQRLLSCRASWCSFLLYCTSNPQLVPEVCTICKWQLWISGASRRGGTNYWGQYSICSYGSSQQFLVGKVGTPTRKALQFSKPLNKIRIGTLSPKRNNFLFADRPPNLSGSQGRHGRNVRSRGRKRNPSSYLIWKSRNWSTSTGACVSYFLASTYHR